MRSTHSQQQWSKCGKRALTCGLTPFEYDEIPSVRYSISLHKTMTPSTRHCAMARLPHALAAVCAVWLLGSVHADQSYYDKKEEIRRAAKQLSDYDQAQSEAAKERYDARNRSAGNGSSAGATVVLLVMAAGVVALMIAALNRNTEPNISLPELSDAERKEIDAIAKSCIESMRKDGTWKDFGKIDSRR